MTVDKRMKYEDQRLTKKVKPVNQGGGPNYLGKQETVTVPKKWLSDPDHVVAELAYITPREQKILLDADLYGSLKGKPNKGPGGVMSLQGDLGGWSSGGGKGTSGGSQGKGGGSKEDYKNTNYYKMMTGQLSPGHKLMHSTTAPGPRTKQYSNLPEYMKVKQKDGTYKNKYIGSAYKSYGQPSLWGNLFSRGAPGYRGIKGLSAFGTPTFEATQGPDGLGYYTDDTDFGETRGAMPFGIMGIIANAINKFKKPKDMSQYSKLQLVDGQLVDDPRIDKIPVPGESAWSDGTFTWGGPTPTSDVPMGTPWDNPYKAPMGTPWDNPYKGPGKYEQAADDYWSDKQIINTPGGEIVIDSQGNEVVDMPTDPMGTVWDNPYREPTVIEDIFEDSGVEPMYQSASLPGNQYLAGLTKNQQKMLEGPQRNLKDIMGISNEEILQNISPFDNPNDPATLEDIQTFYGANGGLASLFNRRG